MKNDMFNRFVTAAAISVTVALSGHAAAEQNVEQAAADGLAEVRYEQAQFGTIQPLDAAKTERVIVTGVRDSIETWDMEVNTQAHNRAEAKYKRHYASDRLPVPQPGAAYQSAAIAW